MSVVGGEIAATLGPVTVLRIVVVRIGVIRHWVGRVGQSILLLLGVVVETEPGEDKAK